MDHKQFRSCVVTGIMLVKLTIPLTPDSSATSSYRSLRSILKKKKKKNKQTKINCTDIYEGPIKMLGTGVLEIDGNWKHINILGLKCTTHRHGSI